MRVSINRERYHAIEDGVIALSSHLFASVPLRLTLAQQAEDGDATQKLHDWPSE